MYNTNEVTKVIAIELVFSAINAELNDIERRRRQHEDWCERNQQDPRDGAHQLACEKMAVARLYPVIEKLKKI